MAALALLFDLARPPREQVSAALLVRGIGAYRATLSPVAGAIGARCRFEPTCSRYAEAVIRRYGALEGTWRAMTRVARCGPWTAPGTPDPPPGGAPDVAASDVLSGI